MSNFLRSTKHPVTGNWELAAWLDDYYGAHRYGVAFKDGTIVAPEKVEFSSSEFEGPDNFEEWNRIYEEIVDNIHKKK